jgi:hypothetical protein
MVFLFHLVILAREGAGRQEEEATSQMKGANKKASGYPKARSHRCCFLLLKSFWELLFCGPSL